MQFCCCDISAKACDKVAGKEGRETGPARLSLKIGCKKSSLVTRKRSTAGQSNCQGKCENERNKDDNVSNLKEGVGGSLIVWTFLHLSTYNKKPRPE